MALVSTNCSDTNSDVKVVQASVITLEDELLDFKVTIMSHVILVIDCNYYIFNEVHVDDVDFLQGSNWINYFSDRGIVVYVKTNVD